MNSYGSFQFLNLFDLENWLMGDLQNRKDRKIEKIRNCSLLIGSSFISKDPTLLSFPALVFQSVPFEFVEESLVAEAEHFCSAPPIAIGLGHGVANHLHFEVADPVLQ